MQLSQEIQNLTHELKARYASIIERQPSARIRRANELVAALYLLSCGSLVVAINCVAGKPWRKVMMDRKAVRALSVALSGHAMVDRILYNTEQFVAICGTITEPRARAQMNRYLAEWHAAADDANARMHRLAKPAPG